MVLLVTLNVPWLQNYTLDLIEKQRKTTKNNERNKSMCLNLIQGAAIIDLNLLGKPNSKGLYSGYKVFSSYPPTTRSLYFDFKWKHGWNESSRSRMIDEATITPSEEKLRCVHYGFHIF
jgi:hypothetical protein